MAMNAYLEAISNLITEKRNEEIREQLLAYCGIVTVANANNFGRSDKLRPD
jgi:hypothetical protein